MIIAIDTETTGVPLWSYPDPYCPAQVSAWPRLVSVAWQVLKSESCTSPQEWIAKPDGFQIPESASQIHGISTEKANKVGTPLKKILDQLYNIIRKTEKNTIVLAAYNYEFDFGVLAAECTRTKHPLGPLLKAHVEWQCIVSLVFVSFIVFYDKGT